MSEMIVDSSKKRQINQANLSWEDKVELCNRWKESGLNKSQFCKKYGLSITTFCEWCNRVWSRSKKTKAPSMTPVRVINKQEIEQQVVVELLLSNQATAKMSVPMTSIGKLIQELCYATATIR
jgi:transcription initiation factor TFIID subunit TAF12